jgi:hypothetical protein
MARQPDQRGTPLELAGARRCGGSQRQAQKESTMNGKKILLAFVLADFVAVTAWGVAQVGYLGLVSGLLATPAGIVGSADMTIALGLIAVWLFQDARARGLSPLPYLVAMVLFGRVGPLLYLLRRPEPAHAGSSARLAAQAG